MACERTVEDGFVLRHGQVDHIVIAQDLHPLTREALEGGCQRPGQRRIGLGIDVVDPVAQFEQDIRAALDRMVYEPVHGLEQGKVRILDVRAILALRAEVDVGDNRNFHVAAFSLRRKLTALYDS